MQTAVEWLFQKLWDEPKDKFTWYAIREKAIQMEKEQIKESWNDGNLLGRNDNILLEYNTGEQYYKETYGKENNND